MKVRILILLAGLLVVACQTAWADSRLESQFPRMAHLFGESRTQVRTKLEKELVAKIELKDGRLIFSMWNRSKGQRSAAICDVQGELASNVRSLSNIRTTEFEFSCGGEKRKTFNSNWGLRLFKGTIDRIELRTVDGEGTSGQGLLVFLFPEDYAEYLKDREERRPMLFGTDEWLEGKGGARPTKPSEGSEGRRLYSTGTGFLVNENFIATADHVLRMNDRGDVCNAVSIMYRHDEYEASIADLDPANDIGLIKLAEPISSTATIRGKPDLRLGETAINYGFPLSGELSTSAKITSGAVNSLAGYNNNSAFIQFDAASQFGNSGGPVLDASGNIIGVVSAKLDDAENQLVNFATKSTILEGFLRANKVPFEKADLEEELELPDIAEKAETFTVLVGCWQ